MAVRIRPHVGCLSAAEKQSFGDGFELPAVPRAREWIECPDGKWRQISQVFWAAGRDAVIVAFFAGECYHLEQVNGRQ